jgi:serine/threonine protein kinase
MHAIGSYMSPELLEGKPYTEKADIYAYGLLLWEIFMSRLPFNECTSPWAMSREILEGTRPMIPRNWPDDLCELVQRCWNPVCSARA